MLLCTSNQEGLTTVQAPKPPITQRRSPSVMVMIIQYLLFLPTLLYQSTKGALHYFTRPFNHPTPNTTVSSDDPQQDSNNKSTTTIEHSLHTSKHHQRPPTQKRSNPLNNKHLKQTHTTATASLSNSHPSAFGTDYEAWNEAWHFANHITYSLHFQTARGVLEEKRDGEELNEDVIAVKELEGRVWDGAHDGGEVDFKPLRRRCLSKDTARKGRRGFVYLAVAGIVCYYTVGLGGVFYWLVSEIVNDGR